MNPRHFDAAAVAAAIAMAGALLISGLGNDYPWGDEADTIFTARNVLKTGLPKAWDGTNLFAWRGGAAINERLWQTRPWLEYYVAAASFRVFGDSVISARLPFVLASLLSLALFYVLILRLTDRRGLAAVSLALLALNPSFLLFGKQARYYSLSLLLSTCLLLAWCHLGWQRPRSWTLFALACTLLFHTNYLTFVALWAALFLATIVIENDRAKAKAILLSSSLSLPFTVPWMLYVKPTTVVEPQLAGVWIGATLRLFLRYLRDYSALLFFPALMIIPLALMLAGPLREENVVRRRFWFMVMLVCLFTLILSAISADPASRTRFANVRYALPALPLLVLLTGGALHWLFKRWKVLAYLLLVLLAATDLLTVQHFHPDYGRLKRGASAMPALPFRSYLADYVYEITHNYTTTYEAIIRHLEDNALPGDIVLTADPFSLMAYFGPKLRFAGMISETDERLLGPNRRTLPPYVYSSRVVPDWIILYGDEPVRSPIWDFLRSRRVPYESIRLQTYGQEGKRPELYQHLFREIRDFPPSQAVTVLRLIKPYPRTDQGEAMDGVPSDQSSYSNS